MASSQTQILPEDTVLLEEFDINSFKPFDGQSKITLSDNKRKIITSANRWGKSYVGMAEILWWARGHHPYRRDVKPAKQLWICVPSYETFERVHMPIFEQLCPPSWLRADIWGNPSPFNKSDHYVDIAWDERWGPGHCRVWVLTYEQRPKTWVGAAVNGCWMDEPPPRAHVHEVMARLRSVRGWLLLTFTPVEGIGWWFESLWKPAKSGKNGWFFLQAALAERDYDNPNPREYEVGRILVPHFRVPYHGVDPESGKPCTCPTPEEWGSCRACRNEVIEFARDFPDVTDREIRIFGEVKGKQGLIYKMFDEEVHVIPPFTLPLGYSIFAGIDPGYHGFHVTIGAIDGHDNLYIVKEIFSQGETTNVRFHRIVNAIRALRPSPRDWPDGRAMISVAVDTEDPQVILELNERAIESLEVQHKLGEKLIVQLSFAAIDQGLKAVKGGLLRIQQMLSPDPKRQPPRLVQREITPKDAKGEVIGEPRIYFFDDLYAEWQGADQYYRQSRILWEIMQYDWKQPSQNPVVKRDEPNKENADGAHAMDSWRYLVMSRFGPTREDKVRAKYEDDFRDDSELTSEQRREKRRVEKFLARIERERQLEDDWDDETWDEYDEYGDEFSEMGAW